jgi:hypothetical protein
VDADDGESVAVSAIRILLGWRRADVLGELLDITELDPDGLVRDTLVSEVEPTAVNEYLRRSKSSRMSCLVLQTC